MASPNSDIPNPKGLPSAPKQPLYAWSEPLKDEADGKPKAPLTIGDAVAKIDKESFMSVAQRPCNQQAFIVGIAGGAALGGVYLVARGKIRKASNWAVFGGVGMSIFTHEYCEYYRRVEKRGMKRSIEMVKEAKTQQAEQAAELEAQKTALEQKTAAEKQAKSSWYKFW